MLRYVPGREGSTTSLRGIDAPITGCGLAFCNFSIGPAKVAQTPIPTPTKRNSNPPRTLRPTKKGERLTPGGGVKATATVAVSAIEVGDSGAGATSGVDDRDSA